MTNFRPTEMRGRSADLVGRLGWHPGGVTTGTTGGRHDSSPTISTPSSPPVPPSRKSSGTLWISTCPCRRSGLARGRTALIPHRPGTAQRPTNSKTDRVWPLLFAGAAPDAFHRRNPHDVRPRCRASHRVRCRCATVPAGARSPHAAVRGVNPLRTRCTPAGPAPVASPATTAAPVFSNDLRRATTCFEGLFTQAGASRISTIRFGRWPRSPRPPTPPTSWENLATHGRLPPIGAPRVTGAVPLAPSRSVELAVPPPPIRPGCACGRAAS